MIIDTSAFLAVVLEEVGARQLARTIATADTRRMSVASYVEAGLKLVPLGIDAVIVLDRVIGALDIQLVAVTPEQAREAVRARARFGRAPARLNFGDCLVYALAKTTGEPLLFKGEDFAHTDIARVPVTAP